MPTFKHPCPQCGTFIQRDVMACPKCGTRDPFAPGRCPACRTPLEDPTWVACPACGAAVGAAAVAAANAAKAEALAANAATAGTAGTAAAQGPVPTEASTPVVDHVAAEPVPTPGQAEGAVCAACGSPLAPDARFCLDCGTAAR